VSTTGQEVLRRSIAGQRRSVALASLLTAGHQGGEALVPVVIQHPLSTLTEAEIDARAADVATQAVRIWLGR